jgi:hypothetical protein
MIAKSDNSLESKIDTLTTIVDTGFRLAENSFTAIAADLGDMRGDITNLHDELTEVRSVMVTKSDHHALRQELLDGFHTLSTEVRDIRDILEELDRRVLNVTGFRKEIEHALERVAAIEKHLGLERRIAA